MLTHAHAKHRHHTCTNMCTWSHAYMHPCTYMHTHAQMCSFSCVNTYHMQIIYVLTHMHLCIHTSHTHTHVHSCMHTNMLMHTHHTLTHAYTHAHMCAHTLKPNQVSAGHPFPFPAKSTAWPRRTAFHLPHPNLDSLHPCLSPPCLPHSDREQAVPSS